MGIKTKFIMTLYSKVYVLPGRNRIQKTQKRGIWMWFIERKERRKEAREKGGTQMPILGT